MKRNVKIALRSILIFLETFFALFILYMMIALWLIMVPVNTDFKNDGQHEVWVMSNGLHTDICLPIDHELKDWSETLGLHGYGNRYNWVAFGWGDRDVYLNTPTWAEADPLHIFNSLFIPTESLIHISLRRTAPTNIKAVQLNLTDQQYTLLVDELMSRLKTEGGKAKVVEGFSYGDHDHFYLAEHDYHMFRTCNNWTNEILKRAGVRSSVWCPIQAGIFYQLSMIDDH